MLCCVCLDVCGQDVYAVCVETCVMLCVLRLVLCCVCTGLSRKLVVNYADVQNTIDHGNNHRMTASTAMNEHSSRSHAIITVTFTQVCTTAIATT